MRLLLPIILLLFSASCRDTGDVSIPDDILSKEKMAEIMVDIHLTEASLSMNFNMNKNKMVPGLQMPAMREDILAKNKVTAAQYERSFSFYAEHPRVLAEVYQLVLNDLSRMQAEVNNGK